jgi:hypothetical protein
MIIHRGVLVAINAKFSFFWAIFQTDQSQGFVPAIVGQFIWTTSAKPNASSSTSIQKIKKE